MNFKGTLLILCFVSSTLALSCIQNYAQTGFYSFLPNQAVGQYVDSAYITENPFIGAGLYRADSTPVSGTFYVIPGQSNDTASAIYSTSFSSVTDTIYANGTATLSSGGYTFLWVRDSNGNSTDVYHAGDWLANSNGFFEGFFTEDASAQFCFNTPPSPSATPSPSSIPSASATPSSSSIPSASATPSSSSIPSASATPSSSSIPSASPSPLPQNLQPTHSILNMAVVTGEVVTINQGTVSLKASSGTNGVRLQLTVNDPDLVGSSNYMTYSISVQTTATTGANATLYVNPADVQCDAPVMTQSDIVLNGTLSAVGTTINRMVVRYPTNVTINFRILINVTDNGYSGVCSNGLPCARWTASRTDFRSVPAV